ncbi:MAG: hypothetical protein EHM34_03910 [Nitrosopumilales archaeon]|nr:MAG: hypothetical protein EHM34_03910 [Nitrosopumilales archaeon]
MKKYLYSLIVPVLVYLGYAFVKTTFNIALWSAVERQNCVTLMALFAIVGLVIIFFVDSFDLDD